MKTDNKTKLGMTEKKEENFSAWYQELILKSELIDYYPVKGCYVMRPNSFFVWSQIKKEFTSMIEGENVKEYYFPMLVTMDSLNKEKDLIENFAPELAWVTKFGSEQLEVPYAIRPTSETIIYPYFSKWIQTYRDLPVKTNQWCNVFRAEITQTVPFLRSKEFLWQEGHSIFLKRKEAEDDTRKILEFYKKIYEELLAVPVIEGRKTDHEKFGGADYTLTTEIYIPDSGRAIQGATSHFLGQNFSKAFRIEIEDELKQKTFLYQNSWGITTRSIGIAAMLHSDNKGLLLPPRVCPVQVIIVPCGISKKTDKNKLYEKIEQLRNKLREHGIRAESDLRENYSPGFKFNYYEMTGVPIRINLGPRDVENNTLEIVRRDDNSVDKLDNQGIHEIVRERLEDIQRRLYLNALRKRDQKLKTAASFPEFLERLNEDSIILVEFCNTKDCEISIKKESSVVENGEVKKMGAKSLCIPFKYQGELTENKCFKCGNQSVNRTLFGRSY